jgi:hypothetical protein
MRDGLSLTPDDLHAIGGFFQSPAAVFLVVKAAPGTKSCTAGFFFWEDGSIQPEFSPLEVALGRTQVATQATTPDAAPASVPEEAQAGDTGLFRIPDFSELQPEPAFEPPPRAAGQPNMPARDAAAPARRWPNLLVRVATIAIATAALVVSVVTYLGSPRSPHGQAAIAASAASLLGLQVERNPPDLLVTWSRDERDIADAERATLTIRDAKSQKSLELDKSQLKRGSYLYPQAGDDIQVRFEVFAPDGGSVAQSIRVVAPQASGGARQ